MKGPCCNQAQCIIGNYWQCSVHDNIKSNYTSTKNEWNIPANHHELYWWRSAKYEIGKLCSRKLNTRKHALIFIASRAPSFSDIAYIIAVDENNITRFCTKNTPEFRAYVQENYS